MPEIKDDAVAFRNRPLIERDLAHQIEKRIASPTSIRPSLKKLIVNCDSSLCTKHAGLPIWTRRRGRSRLLPIRQNQIAHRSTAMRFLDDESLCPVAREVGFISKFIYA